MSITIVTAFFDIGRGNWGAESGHPNYLQRTSSKYLEYFSNLALLDNKMVIYTSKEYVDIVKEIRLNKPTIVVEVELFEKFKDSIEAIKSIQKNKEFKRKISESELKNPEYWSAEYVLVTNLKTYFIRESIKNKLISDSSLVSWVDFGYCRNENTLNNILEWDYSFKKDKINFFTINKKFRVNQESVEAAIVNNQVVVIGGVIVSSQEKWLEFFDIVYRCQKDLLNKGLVDDDQGVYLMALLKCPKLFELNYLGKDKWFDVFKVYAKRPHLNFFGRMKKIVRKFL